MLRGCFEYGEEEMNWIVETKKRPERNELNMNNTQHSKHYIGNKSLSTDICGAGDSGSCKRFKIVVNSMGSMMHFDLQSSAAIPKNPESMAMPATSTT